MDAFLTVCMNLTIVEYLKSKQQGGTVSFLDRLFGFGEESGSDKRLSDDVQTVRTESTLSAISPGELSIIESSISHSITLGMEQQMGTALNALVPLAANAGQAVSTFGMAIVKFPEGVGWADLCVRHKDGWNLLSNFKGGRFNEMAGIKQAGLQPAAVANIALQGAAVAVGQAYMTQINDKLESIDAGISEIQHIMERERDATLKGAYDKLKWLALKYEEFGTKPEKHATALLIIEDATSAAEVAWNYQLAAIRDCTSEVASKKSLNPNQIEEEFTKLSAMEKRASVAFQLIVASQQMGMRFENDYTKGRIETDTKLIEDMAIEYSFVRGDAHTKLAEKISKIKGAPFALADPDEGNYESVNPVLDVLHAGVVSVGRVNPMRMREAAKNSLLRKKASLQDIISTENTVRSIADAHEAELSELSFAFNEADTMLIEGDTVRLLSTGTYEPGVKE